MKRDGANISLWQNEMPDYKEKTAILPDKIFDVAIVGGGITGLATAFQLQKSGKKCILIESHNIGFGTTGGTTAHINTLLETSYDKIENNFGESTSQLVFDAAQNALNTIAANVAELKIDCNFEFRDAYLFSQDEKQSEELDKIVKSSQKVGLETSYTDTNLIGVPFEKVAVFKHQAQFHPSRYIYGLARGFEDAGGILLQHCMMDSFDDDIIITLITSLGKIRAENVVFATHIPPGINLLHFRCAPYRSYVIGVKLIGNTYPDGLVYDMDDPYRYYRTAEMDGGKILVLGGEDHKTGHGEHTSEHFEKLKYYLDQHFPVQKISFRWSSQYYESSDGLAYIGNLPGHRDNVFVATGFGGNGMTYSHISANLLCDLITTGVSVYGKVFEPTRIKPVSGFARFVKENTDVVKEFVAKRISVERIDTLIEVRAGDGKVIKYEGDTVALSKDEEGYHAIDPVCTHAKCIVAWNETENSWDCPCHGARYNPDGEVLNGPSTRKLDNVSIENEL